MNYRYGDIEDYFIENDSGYGYPGRYYSEKINIRDALDPIIMKLMEYDSIRTKLEQKGGRVSDLSEITDIFSATIPVNDEYGAMKVLLSDQRSLKEAIRNINWDLHVDIRRLHTHMPVYYICRTRRDFWAEYSLVVEDIYMSSGYPLTDERFVKLMDAGHEVYYLRLAQFREGITNMVGKTGEHDMAKVDNLLYNLGRHVFQAAWHEDQRLGILTARFLGLHEFHMAIELLYLCLSGDLCELRGAVDETMMRFFEDVYPQPAIRSFLEMLGRTEGGVLTELPQKAANLYKRLSRAFSGFLQQETIWGHSRIRMPIWKLLYSNFSRLDQICKTLKEDDKIVTIMGQLEGEAKGIINELLETASIK